MKNLALEKFINEILSGIKTASEFANEQLPAIAQQALTYRLYSDIFGIIAAICVLVFFRAIFIQTKRNIMSDKMKDFDSTDRQFILAGLVAAIALLSLFPIMEIWDSTHQILKIVYAPKLYLLEYIAHLIK